MMRIDQNTEPCPDGLLDSATDTLGLIERMGGIGVFELELASDRVRYTPLAATLFAVEATRAEYSFAAWTRSAFAADVPIFRAAIELALELGAFTAELRVRRGDGGVRWLTCRGEVVRDAAGAARLQAVCSDVTERKALEARLLALNEMLRARVREVHEEARLLEVLNRTGVALSAELDLQRLLQTVTDASMEITEARYAAFIYNALNAQGEAYVQRTLSGASQGEGDGFPVQRYWPLFEQILRGDLPVRCDDASADPRYADHLSIRSYLAVPVTSRSGDVLGGLFLGHPDAGIFTERSEKLMTGLASQAAIAIDNARLYQLSQQEVRARKQTEQALQLLNQTLEDRISARTHELEESVIQLSESERRFRLLVESVTDYAIYMLDPKGNVVKWNPGAERIKGYSAEEIVGHNFACFYTKEDQQLGRPAIALAAARDAGKFEGEGWRVRKNGSRFWANVVLHAMRDPTGELLGFVKVTRDLTERRAAEERLRQSEKMEAIGQLTGGVAHDFNNLLTVISGNMETLQRRLGERREPGLERLVNLALHASSRAATLTHQLLAFSRRQPLERPG